MFCKIYGSSAVHGEIFLVTNIFKNLWTLKWSLLHNAHLSCNAYKCVKKTYFTRFLVKISLCIIGSWLFQIIYISSYVSYSGVRAWHVRSTGWQLGAFKVHRFFFKNNRYEKQLHVNCTRSKPKNCFRFVSNLDKNKSINNGPTEIWHILLYTLFIFDFVIMFVLLELVYTQIDLLSQPYLIKYLFYGHFVWIIKQYTNLMWC